MGSPARRMGASRSCCTRCRVAAEKSLINKQYRKFSRFSRLDNSNTGLGGQRCIYKGVALPAKPAELAGSVICQWVKAAGRSVYAARYLPPVHHHIPITSLRRRTHRLCRDRPVPRRRLSTAHPCRKNCRTALPSHLGAGEAARRGGGWYPKGFLLRSTVLGTRWKSTVSRLPRRLRSSPRAPRALQIHHTLPLDHPRECTGGVGRIPLMVRWMKYNAASKLSSEVDRFSGRLPTETRKAAETRLHKPALPTTTRSRPQKRRRERCAALMGAQVRSGRPRHATAARSRIMSARNARAADGSSRHHCVACYASLPVELRTTTGYGRTSLVRAYTCGVLASPCAPGFNLRKTEDGWLRRFPTRVQLPTVSAVV